MIERGEANPHHRDQVTAALMHAAPPLPHHLQTNGSAGWSPQS